MRSSPCDRHIERINEMQEKQMQAIRSILTHELRPAMGCTEPIAVAYTAALARNLLGTMPKHMIVRCSGNIVKNVKGVTVPNSGGQKGIDTAAIMGMLSGRSDMELEVLSTIQPEDLPQVNQLRESGMCECQLAEGVPNLYIEIRVEADKESAVVAIQDSHTNLVKKVKNGQVLFEKNVMSEDDAAQLAQRYLNVESILEYAQTESMEMLHTLLDEQVRDNWAIAMEGLESSYGAGVGRSLLKHGDQKEWKVYCRAAAAAGSDARMNGCALPVVINSGSGNQGITVSVPLIAYAKQADCAEEKLYRALAISNLSALHQKKYIGKLSAFCGAISASAAAGAAMAWLQGCEAETVVKVLVNTLAIAGGILCDGAKASCAAKIAAGLEAAWTSLELAQQGYQFPAGEGLMAQSPEDTIRSFGYVAREGMRQTDVEILKLMTGETKFECI